MHMPVRHSKWHDEYQPAQMIKEIKGSGLPAISLAGRAAFAPAEETIGNHAGAGYAAHHRKGFESRSQILHSLQLLLVRTFRYFHPLLPAVGSPHQAH